MSRRTKLALILAAVVAAAVVGGLAAYLWSGDDDSTDAGTTVDPSAAAQTSFPGLATPTGEPTLAGIDTAAPPVGTVVTVPGPFDDRFVLSDLHVTDGAVSGTLTITSDVSELLDLQVLAGFYDATGRFLGTGQAVYHLDEQEGQSHDGTESPNETSQFRILAPKAVAADVAAAAVGVPVLVNE